MQGNNAACKIAPIRSAKPGRAHPGGQRFLAWKAADAFGQIAVGGLIPGHNPPEPGHPGEQILVTLKYTRERKPVISGIRRISRPGQRTYVAHAHIPRVQGGMGTAIISTSRGVMTGHEARQQGVGGEVVATVW